MTTRKKDSRVATTNFTSQRRAVFHQTGDLCCARGRPIIVEWERDARHSAGLSRSVTHRYVTERYTFSNSSDHRNTHGKVENTITNAAHARGRRARGAARADVARKPGLTAADVRHPKLTIRRGALPLFPPLIVFCLLNWKSIIVALRTDNVVLTKLGNIRDSVTFKSKRLNNRLPTRCALCVTSL
ncbi:hypothetical protein EVAR_94307_1 [Eumeta japonica]|uniref:Uncharacterized protein n=1 Tax=Eumeta variegata TaxID=151549 RepID=A0A4C1UGA2_EUMVA|nr:hypothetical protein EVAR_94307_1 [Eumeta japonica]